MVLFWPVQQELDCINDCGVILGKIKYNASTKAYGFVPDNDKIKLSEAEETMIAVRVAQLESGHISIPMQDDD